ncbi:MAG: beta-propeller fold lactonase family protein [Bacilli bacterium]|nr:beta-propeller fold lactonase family protein [Bacilli bacterium]
MKLAVSGYGENIECLTLVDIDTNNKRLNKLDSLMLNQASFVISYQDKEKTYVITYTKKPLKLISYYISDNKLVKIDEQEVPYESLTHLMMNKDNSRLYACSYKDGMILYVDIEDGHFSNIYYSDKKGISLCHCVISFEEEKEIGIIDIKNDDINIYDLNLEYKRSVKINKGAGPRHGIYYNNKLYLVTEYSNEVFVIDYKTGKTIQVISTLSDINNKSYGATLFIKDNRLYASNRGEDNIVVFDMDKDGLLNVNHWFSCFGKHPRHMILSSDKKYIISCNKDTNNIVVIDLEKEEEVLSFDYYMPAGVCNI